MSHTLALHSNRCVDNLVFRVYKQALLDARRLVAHHGDTTGVMLHQLAQEAAPVVVALRSNTARLAMLLLQVESSYMASKQ